MLYYNYRRYFNISFQNTICLILDLICLLYIQVLAGDGLPEFICSKCLMEVEIAYEFREKSQSADAALRKYISLLGLQVENPVQVRII